LLFGIMAPTANTLSQLITSAYFNGGSNLPSTPTTYKNKPPVKVEIATGGFNDITQSFVGPRLYTQDSILATRGNHNLLIYEDILRDEQVRACVQNFIAGVISRSWDVRPGKRRFQEPTRKDKKVADFVREILGVIAFDQVCEQMLLANFYGYAVAEINYAKDSSYVVLDSIKPKKARRFAFDQDRNLRLLTWEDQYIGTLVPPEKFWHFACGSDNSDDPYGLGWAHCVYWPVKFKREGMLSWMKYLEVAGVPPRVGKYPYGTSDDDQLRLLDAARALSSATASIHPDNMSLEYVNTHGGSTPDNEALQRLCNEGIAKLILGQSLTTESAGGQYKAEVQDGVKEGLIKAASDRLSYSFSVSALKTLLHYNRSIFGDDVATPTVYRNFDDEPDPQLRVDVYEKLYAIGFETTEEQIMETFGGEWAKKQVPPAVSVPAADLPKES
jgi:phage gp29-like protein